MSQIEKEKSMPIPQASGLRDAEKKLAEQLKNAFIIALLVFWVSTLNITATRPSWLTWAIGSLMLFLFIVFYNRRRKLRWPKLRWVFPFLAVGLLWLMYFLAEVSIPYVYFKVLAIILILWTIPLLGALITLMVKKTGPQGRLDRIIKQFAIEGEIISWYLTLVALFLSIILGWTRLWNAGITGRWGELILYWGILILVVVSVHLVRRVGKN